MKNMSVNEMKNTNGGAKCKYCKKNKAWYALAIHQVLCGMMFNPWGGQRRG